MTDGLMKIGQLNLNFVRFSGGIFFGERAVGE